MPHSRIHVTKTIIDTLFMRKALATQLYFTLHITPLPAGEGQGGGALWGFVGLRRLTYIYKKKGRHESLAPTSQRIMLINVRFCLIRTKSNNIIFTLKSIKLLT